MVSDLITVSSMVSGRIWASTTATVWWSRDSCDGDIVRAEDAEDGSFVHAYSDESEKGDEVNLFLMTRLNEMLFHDVEGISNL